MRRLAKDTAVYGISSIVGRVLTWLLMPFYVRVLDSTGEYGIITNLYGWTALLQVVLTYGMETGFFRFIFNKEEKQPMKVYSTVLISVAATSLLFAAFALLWLHPIAGALGYGDTPGYIRMLTIIVAIDAFTCIPFVYLRYRGRPYKFVAIKMLNIILIVGFNLFFLLLCPWLDNRFPGSVSWFYRPDYQIGYVFTANLIASVGTLLALARELTGFRYTFDRALWKKIVSYSFPILILGIAGILNQTADKILFPFLFDDRAYADSQLGIYGACFKIAVIMVMFNQAFRYAYEPFVFAKTRSADCKESYALAMKYFLIFALLIFLGVMFYLDIIKFLVRPVYYPGLRVVPVVMLGSMFFGVFFNLSVWYKVIDQTRWGAYFSLLGFVITVGVIVGFAPVYGYMACAWASFACNLTMMLLSYFVGQKKYPVDYDLRSFFFYVVLAAALYAAGMWIPFGNKWLAWGVRAVLLALYVWVVVKRDLPLREIPLINRLIKK